MWRGCDNVSDPVAKSDSWLMSVSQTWEFAQFESYQIYRCPTTTKILRQSESRVYVASLLIPPPGSVMALVSLSPVQQLQAGRAGAVSSLTPGQGRFEALGQHSGSSLALCSTLTRTVTSSGTDQKWFLCEVMEKRVTLELGRRQSHKVSVF